ncbi:GNAT family N-acetyltransferase [Flavisphingomonas formosensis]|uniref:GNAT family N-acetyltransferase n=1 Tax=Flavisphingomonas formosensis TaxID=861534 RepID=UPI0012F8A596|nr:GNAT family N-acetyltransferase [Sphingomonas formosensis]
MTRPTLPVRRAHAGDAAKLSMLGTATFLDSFAEDHPFDAIRAHMEANHSEAAYHAIFADPANAVWILESPVGTPVGFAMLTPPSADVPLRPGDIELKRIYILPGWKGGGHGRALMDAAMAEARARGAVRMLLSVYEKNPAAQAFYGRLGFRRIGEQCFMVGPVPFVDHVMALDL